MDALPAALRLRLPALLCSDFPLCCAFLGSILDDILQIVSYWMRLLWGYEGVPQTILSAVVLKARVASKIDLGLTFGACECSKQAKHRCQDIVLRCTRAPGTEYAKLRFHLEGSGSALVCCLSSVAC